MEQPPISETSENQPLVNGRQKTGPAARPVNAELFFRQEVNRIERQTRKTWLFGGFAVAGVALYLVWLHSAIIGTFLEPTGLASVISGTIAEVVPQRIRALERELLREAPAVAQKASVALQNALPEFRKHAETQIDEVLATMPALRSELAGTIDAYVTENEKELKDFYSSHTEDQFVAHFLNDLKLHLHVSLDEHLKSESGLALADVREISLQRLAAINDYLIQLRTKSRYRMDRSEQLQRRVLATWLEFLNELLDHV